MLKFNINNKSKMLKIIPFALLLFMYGCSNQTQQDVPVVGLQDYEQSTPEISSINNSNVVEKYQSNANNTVVDSSNNENSTVTSYREKKLNELTIKEINLPRKANGKPDYNKITKGSYQEEAYRVKHGDTLYLISYLSGQSIEKIAKLNKISHPYILVDNQIIRLKDTKIPTITKSNVVKTVTQNNSINEKPAVKVVTITEPKTNSTQWVWPTNGKIVQNFGKGDGGNKGIDIAGSKGQPILAAAKGRVAYAGRDLNGYGNLIILRHGDSFLSTYAHNETILVKKDQIVEKGQKIATMGDTDTNSIKLHFEIRHQGESIDPLIYLPKK